MIKKAVFTIQFKRWTGAKSFWSLILADWGEILECLFALCLTKLFKFVCIERGCGLLVVAWIFYLKLEASQCVQSTSLSY